ncbi:MAG: hypothetical protein NT042_07125, partial [Sulfuritalea sp.]|nr:hypothetical protein [Sulfuritalea sp.]
NTLFHHSFNVTFVKAQAAVVVYRDSVVYGVVRGAAGRTVTLLRGSEAVAQQPLAADGTFRFADLAAGDYAVAVEGTPLRSAPTTMDGQRQARPDLELILTESVITGRVRNGADRTVQLTRDAAEVATATVASDESYRFGGLAAGVYRVALVGTQAVSDAMTLDGANTATADLVVPGHGAPTPLAKAQKETRDYLLRVRNHMKKAVDAGVDMQVAITTLDDSDFAYLPVYPELRGPNANRTYLEVEAE